MKGFANITCRYYGIVSNVEHPNPNAGELQPNYGTDDDMSEEEETSEQ